MLRSLIRFPYQFCNCLVITKMIEQVPISCSGLFQHQWVRLGAYGMDCQLGAASLQTVDHGGRAITFWSQRWDTAYLRVTLLSYVTLSHFYIFPLLNIDQCFSSTFVFVSFSHFWCSSVYWFIAVWATVQRWLNRYEIDVCTYFTTL